MVINEDAKNWTKKDEADLKRLIKKRLKTKKGTKDYDFKFVSSLIQGEKGEKKLINSLLKAEVKTDYGAGASKQIFVEHSSWGNPSGIATSKSDYWLILLEGDEYNGEVFIGIKTSRLRKITESIKWEIRGGDSKSSRGKLVKLTKLLSTNTSIKPIK